MSNRLEKVNSLLEKEISKIILRDFNFQEALVTITHIDATANLIEARAFVSVLPEEKTDKIISILNKGVYSIQQKINKLLNMRPIPKIIFVKDEKIREAARIEELLEKIKKTDIKN
ncbi:MAG: Ribosome-binding factor A [Parcubacteria group bacterium GW2011_GWA2_33_14]|nr:MAG: Ribosome-binding factor A [Parcubacteria group bacterium GW2011_GWA2_33_14]OGZ70905.1 MAG: ribosome-binding factor A [Candidatus Staskawiczbacteria bacterium RIFCSPLOWO2_01_FULL_33_13]